MNTSSPGPRLVVHLGFAGSRHLLDDDAASLAALQAYLTERLRCLPAKLGLEAQHFCLGLSQLAVGADTLFTQACHTLGWPQHLLLPQPRDGFLAATGSDGAADFDAAERDIAQRWFDSPHIIHESVVSDAPDRHTRFHDANLELLRRSDLLVCLVQADSVGKSGGTRELMAMAEQQQRPLLEIRVSLDAQGQPQFDEHWHHRERFCCPVLPDELSDWSSAWTGIPKFEQYCQSLKDFAGQQAQGNQSLFHQAAWMIIGTHVIATVLALIVSLWHIEALFCLLSTEFLLSAELLLLGLGFYMHRYLHRSHANRTWAVARLVAEIARSGLALQHTCGHLQDLFHHLPLPAELNPLLNALSALHLRETRSLSHADWQAHRQNYTDQRLNGQIAYYDSKQHSAHCGVRWAGWVFNIASISAILATLGKLLMHAETVPAGNGPILGFLAVLLPIVAVAALSLAAALDLEARAHIYGEMLAFLRERKQHLEHAHSERAFNRLVLECETRLLGENAAWYSRRAFTGVA